MPTGATKGINNVYAEIYVYVILYKYGRAQNMLVAIRCNIEFEVEQGSAQAIRAPCHVCKARVEP